MRPIPVHRPSSTQPMSSHWRPQECPFYPSSEFLSGSRPLFLMPVIMLRATPTGNPLAIHWKMTIPASK
eukprot:gene15020-biopygen23154